MKMPGTLSIAQLKIIGYASYVTLDGEDEKVAACGRWITPDGLQRTITDICWRTNNVTTGDSILCQLESIGTDGIYAGIIAAGASGTETVADTDDNVFKITALTTPYQITSGDLIAVTFEMQSASKNLRISTAYGFLAYTPGEWGVGKLDAGSPAVIASIPSVALKCSTGEFIFLSGYKWYGSKTLFISTSTSPRYNGNVFIVPNRCILNGIFISNIDNDVDISIKLFNSTGNVLKCDNGADFSISLLSTYRYSTAAISNILLNAPAPKTLIPGEKYYLGFSPDSATSTAVGGDIYYSEAVKNAANNIADGWTISEFTANTDFASLTIIPENIARVLPVISEIETPRFTQRLRA